MQIHGFIYSFAMSSLFQKPETQYKIKHKHVSFWRQKKYNERETAVKVSQTRDSPRTALNSCLYKS